MLTMRPLDGRGAWAAKFPDQRETFEKNYRQFRVEIDSIDQAARRIIPKKENKTFLIYHPALTYFAGDELHISQSFLFVFARRASE